MTHTSTCCIHLVLFHGDLRLIIDLKYNRVCSVSERGTAVAMDRLNMVILMVLMLVHLAFSSRDTVQVNTRLGAVRGYRESVLGKDVQSFLGLPYAKPPVGPKRFQRPESYGAWSDEWDGTQLPNSCPQSIDDSLDNFEGVTQWNANTNISEDCLYLNIWTPHRSGPPKAVMVWIFGGGFYAGTSTLDLYDGRIMASEGDVIVVSMQYRIGPMGFLYLGISGAPGNVGLLDQQLAMQWIFNNIQDYGGDNSRITIFGESAGAASVGLHMLSPLSKELFQRAIMQSATALNPWAVDEPKIAKSRSLAVAAAVGCTSDVAEEVLACLMGASFSELTEAMWDIYDKSVLLTPFAPTIDGYFLRQHPIDLLADGNFKKAPILIGVTHDEGAYFLPFVLPKLYNMSKDSINTREKYLQSVRQILHSDDELTAEIVAHEYKNPYHYSRKLSYMDIVDDIVGDYCFICPTLNFALTYSEQELPVYFYQFAHISSKSPWPKWMGALHGYELDMIFALPMNDSNGYTLEEKAFAQRALQLWTNFGKNG